MNIVTDISAWKKFRKSIRGKTIGFVPTMGNLHEGHLSLCRHAKIETEVTVVSIFVNPHQFNKKLDFNLYLHSQNLKQDQILLESAGVDALFLPTTAMIYPDNYEIQVCETIDSTILEGEFRPGHFSGVLTVVLKLLNLIMPTHAYFGEKDYQQYLLIEKMVRSLFLPVKIIPCETVRAPDGVACSSRNSRLNSLQRKQAATFANILQTGRDPDQIKIKLKQLGFTVEYVADRWKRRLAAIQLDNIRLIDNIKIN